MNYKAAIEAILFTMGESVELGRIADAIQLNEKETKKLKDERTVRTNGYLPLGSKGGQQRYGAFCGCRFRLSELY